MMNTCTRYTMGINVGPTHIVGPPNVWDHPMWDHPCVTHPHRHTLARQLTFQLIVDVVSLEEIFEWWKLARVHAYRGAARDQGSWVCMTRATVRRIAGLHNHFTLLVSPSSSQYLSHEQEERRCPQTGQKDFYLRRSTQVYR